MDNHIQRIVCAAAAVRFSTTGTLALVSLCILSGRGPSEVRIDGAIDYPTSTSSSVRDKSEVAQACGGKSRMARASGGLLCE